jgi:hypothetical protein
VEKLNEQLTIANATIEEWTHRKTKKEGLKVNFTVSAPLPKLLAEQLRCAGIYDNDTGRVDLLHKIKDTELLFPVPGVEGALASFFPDVLYCFKARRDEQQFTIEFSAHVTVRAEELHEILKGTADSFQVVLRPRQGQLFEGGTRVDVAASKEPDTGCIACNNGIPLSGMMRADGVTRIHESGADCTRPAEHPDEAPIASAATMGGTHQKRKPRAGSGTVN